MSKENENQESAPVVEKEAKASIKAETGAKSKKSIKEAVAEEVITSPEASEKKAGQPSADDLLKEDLGEVKIRRAKGSKNIASGTCHILATFNNTKITFTDKKGQTISWSSSGKCGFRGSRKSTAYASQVATQEAGRVAISHGMKEVNVCVKGPGMGRDSAIRAVQALGLAITEIVDATPVPHNGCRPPKRRRV